MPTDATDVPDADPDDELPETVDDSYAEALDEGAGDDDDSSDARLPTPDVPYGTPGNPLGPGAGG